MSEKQNQSLAERFNEAPHLFDVDMAKLVHDTLGEDGPENLRDHEISSPTNLFKPTVFEKDTTRAGKDRTAANHMGMIGPVSALPANYTHAAIVERKRRSASLFDFFELFAKELREFLVEAHRKYRLPSLFQLYRTGSQNAVTGSIFSLLGFATERQRKKLRVHEEIPLYYAGYFADQRRPAICLELMLNDFLGLPVKVQQLFKRRLDIAEDEQTRINSTNPLNSALGQTAVAGASCMDRTGSIRVTIGPVNYTRYLALMPDRGLYGQLVELIQLYCGISVKFDIQVILNQTDVPQTRLDSNSGVGRLGWDTWALQGNAKEDSRDTIFDPDFVKAV